MTWVFVCFMHPYFFLDPWGDCISTYISLIFMVNVGKYTSPMDPMGPMETAESLYASFLAVLGWLELVLEKTSCHVTML